MVFQIISISILSFISPAEGVTIPNKLYRHPDMLTKIKTASLIKFKVYDLITSRVVSELLFNGTNNVTSWFAPETLVNSSLWKIRLIPGKFGAFFQMTGLDVAGNRDLKKFFINYGYNGCQGDIGGGVPKDSFVEKWSKFFVYTQKDLVFRNN